MPDRPDRGARLQGRNENGPSGRQNRLDGPLRYETLRVRRETQSTAPSAVWLKPAST